MNNIEAAYICQILTYCINSENFDKVNDYQTNPFHTLKRVFKKLYQ